MKQYIILIIMTLGLFSCLEEKETLELNIKPTVLHYHQYTPYALPGQYWESGTPIVRGDEGFLYDLLSVTFAEEVLDTTYFNIDENGVVFLEEGNEHVVGQYTLAIEVKNEYGSFVNEEAIVLTITDSFMPEITINTKTGTNKDTLYINPGGQPVDELGNEIEGILPGVTITFTDMSIGEVLMTPSDLFLFDRESSHVEGGSSEVGVVEMVGPFEPGTVTLKFNGAISQPEEDSLILEIVRLNLPYDKDIFEFDLSNEAEGPRNGIIEALIGGMQTFMVYGDLVSGKPLWNVKADPVAHPVDSLKSDRILRWLSFNSDFGYDNDLSNKSQVIITTGETADLGNAVFVNIKGSFLSNKAANLSTEQYRCDVRMVSEEDYQAMLQLGTQAEMRDAVNSWKRVYTSYGDTPAAGVADNSGSGFYRFEHTVNKADFPSSASGQYRFLFHMVADKENTKNVGYIAPQTFTVDGTFIDQD
ncbi:hypothetical protein E9993_09480 [Labilibacter sediminis]|nr:hypothetical protein E9993_09480 [Labilibacter sediminis]